MAAKKTFSRGILVVAALTIALGARAGAAHELDTHVAFGTAEIGDGLQLSVDASARFGEKAGEAWLSDDEAFEGLRIELTCLEFGFANTPYPIWPNIPFHTLHASGIGADGEVYYLTVYDRSPLGAGHPDHAWIETEPVIDGTCGAGDASDGVVLSGDFVIAL